MSTSLAVAVIVICLLVVGALIFSAYIWVVGATHVLGVSLAAAVVIYITVLAIMAAISQLLKAVS